MTHQLLRALPRGGKVTVYSALPGAVEDYVAQMTSGKVLLRPNG